MKKNDENTNYFQKNIYIGLIALFVLLLIIFFVSHLKGNELGDAFNGLIGPFISLFAALLVYSSFKEQIEANRLQKAVLENELANIREERRLKYLPIIRVDKIEFISNGGNEKEKANPSIPKLCEVTLQNIGEVIYYTGLVTHEKDKVLYKRQKNFFFRPIDNGEKFSIEFFLNYDKGDGYHQIILGFLFSIYSENLLGNLYKTEFNIVSIENTEIWKPEPVTQQEFDKAAEDWGFE